MVARRERKKAPAQSELSAGETPLVPDAVAAAPAGDYLGGFEGQRAVARDSGRPLEERLEAFEDVFDSEVGVQRTLFGRLF